MEINRLSQYRYTHHHGMIVTMRVSRAMAMVMTTTTMTPDRTPQAMPLMLLLTITSREDKVEGTENTKTT